MPICILTNINFHKMTPHSFWTLVLKIIGFWMILNCLLFIPQFISPFFYGHNDYDFDDLKLLLAVFLLIIVFYLLVIRMFLFKTDSLIRYFRLDHNFQESTFSLTLSEVTVLRIALIVMSGIALLDSIPGFCSNLFEFTQQKILFKDYPNAHWLVFQFVKSGLALWVLSNSRRVAGWVTQKARED